MRNLLVRISFVVCALVIAFGISAPMLAQSVGLENHAAASVDDPILRMNLGPDDPIIDPAVVLYGGSPASFIVNQLFLGLFSINDETGEPSAALVESWTENPSKTQFTFTLRSDLDWTNGNPITAYDARYGILRSLDPATGSSLAYALFMISNAEEYNNGTITNPNLVGVTALDSTTIQFDLDYSASYLPNILTLPITRPLPEAVITAHPTDWTEPANIVTSGAYKLLSWTHGSAMTLVKNADYFEADEAQIAEISITLTDEATAWTNYLAGSLDTVLVPDSEWGTASSDPILQSQLHGAPRVCTYYYGFNISKPPFDKLFVRKAFISAVDRQGVIDSALGTAQMPTLTFTTPGAFGYVDGFSEGVGIPYNPAQAQQWLAAAGHPGGAGLPPITLMYNTGPGNAVIATAVRQNWMDNLGVTVTLDDLDWSTYLDLLDTDPPQIWRLGWCADTFEAMNFLYDAVIPNNFAYGGWNNTTYNNYLGDAGITSDLTLRQTYYTAAEEILVETDAVMLTMYTYANGFATKPRLERTYGHGGYGGYVKDWRITRPEVILNISRMPDSIIPGSAPSGPNQWYTRVAPSLSGGEGAAFHFVVWLHIPNDWQLPWARQYSFTGDFMLGALTTDWTAKSWIENPVSCEHGGGPASFGYKWRAWKGPAEVLPAEMDRLTNYLNLRGGLQVPVDSAPGVYRDIRVVTGVYYDSDTDSAADTYQCDAGLRTTITIPPSGLTCIPEGGNYLVSTSTLLCCPGLDTLIYAYEVDAGCAADSSRRICTYCGDGMCSEFENVCNCPVDCP